MLGKSHASIRRARRLGQVGDLENMPIPELFTFYFSMGAWPADPPHWLNGQLIVLGSKLEESIKCSCKMWFIILLLTWEVTTTAPDVKVVLQFVIFSSTLTTASCSGVGEFPSPLTRFLSLACPWLPFVWHTGKDHKQRRPAVLLGKWIR